MKTIMIAAPSSGSGKTTVTMGLIRALQDQGLDVCGYKIGPDYIDPAFLQAASGKPTGNLDLHLQGESGVQYALSLSRSEYCIVEGVMGYFDGISNTYRNSSYHLATLLEIPTVLVYTPKGEMFSVIPKLQGMAEFENSSIKAIIFNNVSEHYYESLKEAVQEYTPLQVLGFLPSMKNDAIESRHLGLIQSVEIDDLEDRIGRIADAVKKQIDLPAFLSLMHPISMETPAAIKELKRRDITVAVARDRAFAFYYRENLALLKRTCNVVYFSPLNDSFLPACDFLYLGGGYPEVFRHELARNIPMIQSIKRFAENSGCVYAECGGFMYLTEYIEESRMVGIFKGKTSLTPQLQRFGYIDIELKVDCLLGQAGTRLAGHEFHKSVSEITGTPVLTINKAMGAKTWECGYRYKNVLAGYPHISFIGNISIFTHLLDYIDRLILRRSRVGS